MSAVDFYRDRNKRKIKAGDVIHNLYDNSYELVFATSTPDGEDDLGVNASNIDYLERHPDEEVFYYSLLNFDLNDWEIVGTLENNLINFTPRQIRLLKFLGKIRRD